MYVHLRRIKRTSKETCLTIQMSILFIAYLLPHNSVAILTMSTKTLVTVVNNCFILCPEFVQKNNVKMLTTGFYQLKGEVIKI